MIRRASVWVQFTAIRLVVFYVYHAALLFGWTKTGLLEDGPDVFALVDPRVSHAEVIGA